jgi:hypothetical protein
MQKNSNLNRTIRIDESHKCRVHQVQCEDRWHNRCLHATCPFFRIHNGNHYCLKPEL